MEAVCRSGRARRRRLAHSALPLLTAVAFALCGGSAAAGQLPALTLALVVPAARDSGRVGEGMRHAAELALADWEGRLDRAVQILIREDPFHPGRAVTLARQLARDGVWGVVGHFYSSSAIAASAIYAEAGIPQLVLAATHPRLTEQAHATVLRLGGRDDQQAATAADFVLARFGSRRVALVDDRTEYGGLLATAFRERLEARGMRRIVHQERIVQGETNFREPIARILAARADAVYFGGIFREAGLFLRQMRQAGGDAVFVGGDGALDPEFAARAGEPALRGVYLTGMPEPQRLPTAVPVVARYEARHGPMGFSALAAYDAVGAYLWAARAAAPNAASSEELQRVLAILRSRAYPGALGMLRWDRRGDRIPSPYAIYTTLRGGSLHGWFTPVPPLSPGASSPGLFAHEPSRKERP